MFYVFDTLPIVLCLTTYILFHPGHLLPEPVPQQKHALGADLEGGKQQSGKQGAESTGSGSEAFKVHILQE